MSTRDFIQKVQSLLANNDIEAAIAQLRSLLNNTPNLNQILQQSGRFANISKQIQNGTVSFEQANVTTNQIRLSLLEIVKDLVDEIESQTAQPSIAKEIEQAIINITDSKNLVVNSNIQAGGNVVIGDQVHTESETTKKLGLFLYLFVPLLAISTVFIGYKYQEMKRPLTLKVLVENKTPNKTLPEPIGNLTLTYGNVPILKKDIKKEALYEEIPANYRGKDVRIQYAAKGFNTIDTSILLDIQKILLPVYRNDDLANILGIIKDENGQAKEGVSIAIDCCKTKTDASGRFNLRIPFAQQRLKQRLEITMKGYKDQSITTPVIKGELLRYILEH